jgi:hypothetical protein
MFRGVSAILMPVRVALRDVSKHDTFDHNRFVTYGSLPVAVRKLATSYADQPTNMGTSVELLSPFDGMWMRGGGS